MHISEGLVSVRPAEKEGKPILDKSGTQIVNLDCEGLQFFTDRGITPIKMSGDYELRLSHGWKKTDKGQRVFHRCYYWRNINTGEVSVPV